MTAAAAGLLSQLASVQTCLSLGLVTLIYVAIRARSSSPAPSASGKLPPSLPFSWPLVGHLPEFLWDAEKLLGKATSYFGPTVPIRFRLLNRNVCMLNGPSNIAALFKSTRFISSEEWLVQVLVKTFGVDPADAKFYLNDNTGIGVHPQTGSNNVLPEHRIFHLVYRSVHDGLSGARLEGMQNQVIRNLSKQLSDVQADEDSWTAIPDLYDSFIRKMCFTAAATSLCGSRIFQVVPTLEEDFWHFDKQLPKLFKELPPWLAPTAYRARDVMKRNLAKWHAHGHSQTDLLRPQDDNAQWDEVWGSSLMRARHSFFPKMPLSAESVAADDLGLLWAATANAIPAIGWMVLEILQRPSLLERVRAEIAPCITGNVFDPDSFEVDVDRLCEQTLLQSIYAEVLRVHNGTVIARFPKIHDFSIGGWNLPKDEVVMISTYNTARATTVWNEGSRSDPHPLDEFWPERFVVDPKNPSSGPTKAATAAAQQSAAGQGGNGSPSAPTFSLHGTEGSWVPYGGGSRMCPGRHFAKKELLLSTSMLLTAFDFELAPREGWIRDDTNYFMFGVMHPKGPIPARIRRRRQASAVV
ncbi:hypothetical protein NLU13_6858 [Sarocladium strictum]|uniref:Cytochrome P450 n=1 Tax=Sarocladium strictum TaxID=5046 RepID=A0AA39L5W3_SARSR|nr:hypothetical protein NLU13_6858 [Sarocladium strictum]